MNPIDFHGKISLDSALASELQTFLQAKEAELCRGIVYAFFPYRSSSLPDSLVRYAEKEIKLSGVIELLSQWIHELQLSSESEIPLYDSKGVVKQINHCLWEYVQILEGGVKELFRQLDQYGFEQWQPDLLKALETIKRDFDQRLEDLSWKVSRLEGLLWEYRWVWRTKQGKGVFFLWLTSCFRSLLDRSLKPCLKKNRNYLNEGFLIFNQRLAKYSILKSKVDALEKKLDDYPIYLSLDPEVQYDFGKIYHFLKLWESNESIKALSSKEIVLALKQFCSIEKGIRTFKIYFGTLVFALFEMSRKLKGDLKNCSPTATPCKKATRAIHRYKAEVHTLCISITSYRNFLLRTDPNPYVSSRWGFSEPTVGPEPVQTKELLNTIYELENLDKRFDILLHGLEKGAKEYDDSVLEQQCENIETSLQEMQRPLCSYYVMKTLSLKVLDQISEIDELGSFNQNAVERMGFILSRAMRADWQYHILFNLPRFHEIYAIHQGVLGSLNDSNHLRRKERISHLMKQIEVWMKEGRLWRYTHQVEADINDVKGYLQDFFASLQRIFYEDDVTEDCLKAHVKMMMRQLLEYRYLFGQFFYFLNQQGQEGVQLREQFRFVDQYFDAAETLVSEILSLWSPA